MSKLTRRKLLKGTATGVPLLALASSKSVWAGGCMSPSGAMSNNFSGKVNYDCKGTQGASPLFWKSNVKAWPKVVFPGLFLFSDTKFNSLWDWTRGIDKLDCGSKTVYGWSKSSVDSYVNHENYGSYASTWSGLLGSMAPKFTRSSSLWESLVNGSEGGEKEEEYHMAAALLNASHGAIDYGYDVMQLLQFCGKAEESGNTKIFNKFIDSLVSLNERGSVDNSSCQVYGEDDLAVFSYISKSRSKYSYRSGSGSSSISSRKTDSSALVGRDSDYPATS